MGSIRLFRHQIKIELLALAFIELSLLIVSFYLGAYFRFGEAENSITSNLAVFLPRGLVFGSITILAMFAMGLYQSRLRVGLVGFLLRISAAFVFSGLTLAVIFYVIPSLYIGRGVLLLALMTSGVCIGLARAVFFNPRVVAALRRRVLVLGTGPRAESLLHLHGRADLTSVKIMGFVPAQGEKRAVDEATIVQCPGTLVELAQGMQVDEILVAVEDRRKRLPLDQLIECRMRGVSIIDDVGFFERESGKIRLDMLQPSWFIFSEGFDSNIVRNYSKRLFDISASLTLFALVWPVMALTAAAIYLEGGGRGPIFYGQCRVGQHGSLFQLLKFRNMRVDAESNGKAQWAQTNDVRVTHVGRIIRRYRVDELPQLLNVIRGEMSFIGPRPERPEFVNELDQRIKYYRERHRVKPGLSGWAQLCYPYGATESDAVEKLQYDLYYLKNHSMLLDLSILIQTAEVVFFGKGVR